MNDRYTELHTHLLGSIAPQTVQQLAEKYRDTPPVFTEGQQKFLEGSPVIEKIQKEDLPLSQTLCSFTSLDEFLACYVYASSLIRSVEDLDLLTKSVIEQAKYWKVEYLEITFSPTLYTSKGIKLEECIEVFLGASRNTELQVEWLLDPIRNNGPEVAITLLNDITEYRRDFLAGVSLAGSEYSHSLESFLPYFQKAKSLELGTTVHAGENKDPEKVWEALQLPIDRIGHGVAIVEDQKLIDTISDRNITLEICPTGNIKTGLFNSLSDHPIKKLFHQGLKITVNADDPFFFQTNVKEEHARLKDLQIFSDEELRIINENSRQGRFR